MLHISQVENSCTEKQFFGLQAVDFFSFSVKMFKLCELKEKKIPPKYPYKRRCVSLEYLK